MERTHHIGPAAVILIATIVSGCGSDARLHEMAQQSLDRQAEQNQIIADHSKQITQATEKLVEADAQARREFAELQRETQTAISVERQNIDQQRQELNKERRAVELDRRRAPVIAAAVTQVGLILACLTPLGLAGYLLYVLRHSSTEDEIVTQILIEEVMAEEPRLLLGGPGRTRPPALPRDEPNPDTGTDIALPF